MDEQSKKLADLEARLRMETENRRRAEESLRQSEDLLRALFDGARDGIVLADASSGRITDCNRVFQDLTGRTREELFKLAVKDLFLPESSEAADRIVGGAITSNDGSSLDVLEIRKPDGTLVPIELIFRQTRIDQRDLLLGMVRDLTERRRVEDQLRQSEARYRLLAENSTDIIWTTDMNLRHTYLSPSAERESGFTLEEAMALPLDKLYTPQAIQTISKVFLEQMEIEAKGGADPDRLITIQAEAYRKDGSTTWIELHLKFLRDSEGKAIGLQGVTRNIQERKQAELELRKAYEVEKTLRGQLEEEMGRRIEFTRALIHELKNPLTSIVLSGRLLEDEGGDATSSKLAANINQSAARLDKRIGELLDMAKGETGTLEMALARVDPLEVLADVAEEMRPVFEARAQSFTVHAPSTLPAVIADRERLCQVLANLLGNACRYTPQGGSISLVAAVDELFLSIRVEDNGPGVPGRDREHIFDPYFRGGRAGQRPAGMGIGLALSKAIVELHGGKIWLESHEGQGSIFGFTVPLAPQNGTSGVR